MNRSFTSAANRRFIIGALATSVAVAGAVVGRNEVNSLVDQFCKNSPAACDMDAPNNVQRSPGRYDPVIAGLEGKDGATIDPLEKVLLAGKVTIELPPVEGKHVIFIGTYAPQDTLGNFNVVGEFYDWNHHPLAKEDLTGMLSYQDFKAQKNQEVATILKSYQGITKYSANAHQILADAEQHGVDMKILARMNEDLAQTATGVALGHVPVIKSPQERDAAMAEIGNLQARVAAAQGHFAVDVFLMDARVIENPGASRQTTSPRQEYRPQYFNPNLKIT